MSSTPALWLDERRRSWVLTSFGIGTLLRSCWRRRWFDSYCRSGAPAPDAGWPRLRGGFGACGAELTGAAAGGFGLVHFEPVVDFVEF